MKVKKKTTVTLKLTDKAATTLGGIMHKIRTKHKEAGFGKLPFDEDELKVIDDLSDKLK